MIMIRRLIKSVECPINGLITLDNCKKCGFHSHHVNTLVYCKHESEIEKMSEIDSSKDEEYRSEW
jgi:hypothetical protein